MGVDYIATVFSEDYKLELITRYSPHAYGFAFAAAVIFGLVLGGLGFVAVLLGHPIQDANAAGTYRLVTNITFIFVGGLASLICAFAFFATAVQMAVIDIHDDTQLKFEKQKKALTRGCFMFFANLMVGMGALMLTYSSQNLGFGSPILSEYVLFPIVFFVVFVGGGMAILSSPPVRQTV